MLSNIFLALVPFIPPTGKADSDGYPYFVFPIVGVGVLLFGVLDWYLWTRIWPKIGGYRIAAKRLLSEVDGHEVVRYRKISDRDEKIR